MRRLFVVLALFGMMAGLDALKVEAVGNGHPLTLAALGFVLLAAFALAELGARLGLSKVTGFVVSGFVLGPFVDDLLDRPFATELDVFRGLTLGLIALRVGLDLDLRGLVGRGRLLGYTIALQIVATTVLVGGAVLGLLSATDLLPTVSAQAGWALALVVAALALGSSPAVALAVAREQEARGLVTSLALDVAVLKGFFVTLCVALAIAVSGVVLGAGTALDAGGVVRATEELGWSLIAGAVGGGLIILLLRVTQSQILLLASAMVLVVSEFAAAMGLAVLLVFVVAGVLVRSFSPHAAALRHPLRRFSFPIFIVFFTTLGAELDIGSATVVLPAAVVLCGARALAYLGSSWLAARLTDQPEPVRRVAWLTYLPQGEVALGMVGLAAAGLPDIASPLVELGAMMVAIDVVVGSIATRVALHRARETPDAASDEASTSSVRMDASQAVARLESPKLRRVAEDAKAAMEQAWSRWMDETLRPAVEGWAARLRLPEDDDRHVAARVADRLDRVPPDDSTARLEKLRTLIAMQLDRIDALPHSEAVPLEQRYANVVEGDPFGVRWEKRVRSGLALLTGRKGRRVRTVPVRLLARTALEPRVVRLAEETWRDWQRFEIVALEVLQRAVLGTESVAEANRDLAAATAELFSKVAANVEATVDAGIRELVSFLERAGAPGVSSSTFRYSRVERDIEAALERIAEDADQWKGCRLGAIATLRFIAKVENAQHQLVQDIVRDVAAPLDEAFAIVGRLVEEQRQRIQGLPKAAAAAESDEEWERLALRARALLPKPVLKEMRAADHKVRRATSTSAPMAGLLAFVADREENVEMVPSLHAITVAPRPARVETVTVDVRELKEVQIAEQLLPNLERALAEVGEAFTEIRETTREAAHLVELAFDTVDRARANGESLQPFDEATERATLLLSSIQERACGAWSSRRGDILSSVGKMSNRMFEALMAAAGGDVYDGAPTAVVAERLWARTVRRVRTVFGRLEAWARGWLVAETGQAAEELAHLYRLRAGIERLDARAIRGLVTEQERLHVGRLPAEYASLYASEPLRDPRFFVANREALDTLVRTERAWHAQPESGNGVLVVGPSGSGKSSLLGVARLKVSARRVLVLRPAHDADASIATALAQALGTEAAHDRVQHALTHQRSTIVLDDLQDWFSPTPEGIEAFEAFLRLVSVTEASTFWIVAMRAEAFEAWNHVVGLEHVFAAVPFLRPVTARDLEAIVTARQRFSRFEVVYPTTLGARIAERLLHRPARTTFIRHLAAASHGNLRRAMQLWCAHARSSTSEGKDDVVVLSPIHAIGWGLPFIHRLEPLVKAALGILARHGPVTSPILARAIGAGEQDADRVVRFLLASGLVERLSASPRVALRASIRDDIVLALEHEGVLGGGEA